MGSFIKSVLLDLKNNGHKLDKLHYILPSRRAGIFLRNELSKLIDKPVFSPKIESIEEFVQELSGLKQSTPIELLFKFYESYKTLTPLSEQEPFESFSTWAPLLIQDFNEIDRYLIDQEKVFDYLKAIKELNHWSLESNQTEFINNHLKFWNRLKLYYTEFSQDLLEQKTGFQGLLYREACNNLEVYIENNANTFFVFLGFNALNTAESTIIQGLLQNEQARIYWDADKTFMDDPIHDAGLFLREYQKNWKIFSRQPFNWISSEYTKNKRIKSIGVPKNVGQAKYIGQILKDIGEKNPEFKGVSVVLGEENLLVPLLNSLPKSVDAVNITMGLPLQNVPLASLFKSLFALQIKASNKYYYKDVLAILSNPAIQSLCTINGFNHATELINHIQKQNLVYIEPSYLLDYSKETEGLFTIVFNSWENDPSKAIGSIQQLILMIQKDLKKSNSLLELEYLYRFHVLFNQLKDLNDTYQHLKSISALHSVFKELIKSETLDFKGEPLTGLQIMGMLESRVLDYETVIISSVNEGILPGGKSNSSFIPFDVKTENQLPTYKEKDAVYTYHFYRLLQRAKNIYLIYNTEVDSLKGGEKSRFITQLEVEGIHKISHSIVSPDIPIITPSQQKIIKTEPLMAALKQLGKEGLSPSSLSNYVRNPLDFYFEKVLGVKDFEDVEENIAANTLGSAIHNALEVLYKPVVNKFLTIDILEDFKKQVETVARKQFEKIYKKGDFSKGKNLIIFEIAKRYISNFIDIEIKALKAGHKIKIIAIEAELNTSLSIDGIDAPIHLKGIVDRVDEFNGVTRIIDYKTGKVEQGKVEIVNWGELTTDYDRYSKPFQILCYAYMMYKEGKVTLPVEAGIFSFKNLKAGFLKFAQKPAPRSKQKNHTIDAEVLNVFEAELSKLILEIFNPQINFVEKDIE